MEILTLSVGELQTNCYILTTSTDKSAIIIDPGGEPERIVSICEEKGLQPTYVINTHSHADHIAGNPGLKEKYPDCKIAVSQTDADMFKDPVSNLSMMLGLDSKMPEPDLLIDEDTSIPFGEHQLEIMETPGHTTGSVSLMTSNNGKTIVFCGDLIFANGMGRTDLPGGDHDMLRNSIKNKIFSLPDETVLYPGHGPKTTVGQEKQAQAI